MIKTINLLVKITTLVAVVLGLSLPTLAHAQGNGNGNKKVTICHVPGGNAGNAHTITVSENALSAHLAHGDYEGPCVDGPEVETIYVDVTGIVASYDEVTGLIYLEDGTVLILYYDIDFDLAPGDEILVRAYEIEDGRFVVIWITLESELPEAEETPHLPVWIDLVGQVTEYNAEFGTFLLNGSIPVILTIEAPDFMTIEDGTLVAVHGELLPDGRILADNVDAYAAVVATEEGVENTEEQTAEIPTEGLVTICHIPPGNGSNAHTITVDASSVDAHIAHGDYVGACGEGESEVAISDKNLTVIETECAEGCNPELLILADSYNVAYPALIELEGRGYNIVEISRFYIIADLVAVDVEEVIGHYETAEHNWAVVLEQYPDLTPATFRAHSNLGNGR